MKIGIATFHCAHNYGAVLQSYAMQRLCETFGESSLIDYRPAYLTGQYDYRHWLPKRLTAQEWKNSAILLRNMPVNRRRAMGFDAFIEKQLRLSGPAFVKAGDCPVFDFDAVVCGSDQIWNTAITNGVDPVYYGNVRNGKPYRRVAFAASAGEGIGEKYLPAFAEEIRKMDAFALREPGFSKTVAPYTDKPVTGVLDPTLLVEREVWAQIAKKPDISAPYILVYQVDRDPAVTRMARQLSAITGLGVLELLNYKPLTGRVFRQLAGASPEEFLGYFQNARFVVTNSFHGTAFSLVFEKEFYTLPHPTRPQRMRELLNGLGLSGRLTDSADWVEGIDYEAVRAGILKERQSAMTFLRESLTGGGTR